MATDSFVVEATGEKVIAYHFVPDAVWERFAALQAQLETVVEAVIEELGVVPHEYLPATRSAVVRRSGDRPVVSCGRCARPRKHPIHREEFRGVLSGICGVCGCRDDAACNPPCFWVDPLHMLCSACAPDAPAAPDEQAPAPPPDTPRPPTPPRPPDDRPVA